jgi:ribosomal protein L37AE/L43A
MKELNQICTNALNVLAEDINEWANEKGWNNKPDSLEHKAEQIALMHSELSECLEFLRKRSCESCPNCPALITEHLGLDLEAGHVWKCHMCYKNFIGRAPKDVPAMDDHVPTLTGEAAELADLLIRVFHYCGKRNINIGEAVRVKHQYNMTRPYRHNKNC